jgi:hypothetical protein
MALLLPGQHSPLIPLFLLTPISLAQDLFVITYLDLSRLGSDYTYLIFAVT